MAENKQDICSQESQKEKWADIKGYEGIYQVSNMGKVKSLDRISPSGQFLTGIIMKLTLTRNVLRVSLCKDSRYKHRDVHRLVAEAFIPSEEGYRTVKHKNGIYTDNRTDNLEWVEYTDFIKKQKAIQPRQPLNMYKMNGQLVKTFKSITDAVLYLKNEKGISATITGISHATNGRIKSAYKYKWKRATK